MERSSLPPDCRDLRGEASEADEPGAAVGEVVVEEMVFAIDGDGEAGDVAGVGDAEEVLLGGGVGEGGLGKGDGVDGGAGPVGFGGCGGDDARARGGFEVGGEWGGGVGGFDLALE